MATKSKRTVSTGAATTDTAPQADRRQRGPCLSRVSLIGRLTADPQLHFTANGIAVTNFRLANNGTDEVQFHTVVAWRGLAEIAAKHLSKGRLVYVGGRLNGRTWSAPDGTGRYAQEIVADDIQFLTPKPPQAARAA